MAEKRLARPQPASSSSQPAPPSDPCPICLQPRQPGESWLQLPTCSHAFHEECATELRLKWNVECGKCPVCRQPADALTPVSVLLRDAARHRDRKEYQQCLEKLLEVIALDENHPVANAVLGEIYWNEGSMQKAKSCWQKAHQGGIPEVIFNLGVLHDREGDIEQAKRYFMEAHNKGEVDATCNLGVIHEKEGDMEQAKRYYMEAHKKGNVNATFNLGVIHEKEGDVEQANQYYMEAHNKGHVNATCNLGVMHLEEGDVEQANQYYMEAHSKGDVMATFNLGVIHKKEGDVEQAKRYFLEAHNKGSVEATFNLGVIHEKEGDMEQAKRYFMEAHNKGDVRATFQLGTLHTEEGELTEAERYFTEAYAHPGNNEAAVWLGFACEKMGKMPEARKWYEEGMAKGCASAFLDLGYLAMSNGEADVAEQHFAKVLQNEDEQALLPLGLLRQRSGQAPEAEKCYTAAIRFGSITARLCLATLYMTTGRQEEAAEQLPTSHPQLHNAQRELLRLKMKIWWREPAMCALVAGYVYLLQGDRQSAEALYAEARAGGLDVPPELFAAPPGFANISAQWAATKVEPRPTAAHERPQEPAADASSNSSSSPSVFTQMQSPPVPGAEAAPVPREDDVSRCPAPVHQGAAAQEPPSRGSSTANLPEGESRAAEVLGGALKEVLKLLVTRGSSGSVPSDALSHEQQQAPPAPAAVSGADEPDHRGAPSTSSSSAHGERGPQVPAQLPRLKVRLQVRTRFLEGAQATQRGNKDSPCSKPEEQTTVVLEVAFGEKGASEGQPSGSAAPPGASNASSSSSSSTTPPLPDPHRGLLRALAELEELSVEHNKRVLQKPPRELVEEQAILYQQIRIQRDPALMALESPEQVDKENADVIQRVREQQLAEASEKLYLLTFNPQKNQRDELHDRLWLSPSLRPILAALEEAGLPYELPAPQLLANGELAPGEVHWTGVKMLVPVRLHQKAKDLLRMCRKTLWPRSVVVSDSTMPLVMKSLGTLGKRHASRILCDEDVQVHLLGTVDTGTVHPPSLPNIPKIQMLSEPPLRKSKQEVTNSTEAGSHYQNPRRFLDQLETYSASPRAATDGQPADDASSDG